MSQWRSINLEFKSWNHLMVHIKLLNQHLITDINTEVSASTMKHWLLSWWYPRGRTNHPPTEIPWWDPVVRIKRNYTKFRATDAHFWIYFGQCRSTPNVWNKTDDRQAKHTHPLRAHINWRNPWNRLTANIRQETLTQVMQKAGVPHRATSANYQQ